jgi:hypothetical protein
VIVEGNGKPGIELELPCKLRVGFKPPVKKASLALRARAEPSASADGGRVA